MVGSATPVEDLTNSFVTSDIDVSGIVESDSGNISASPEAHKEAETFETSVINISGDESDAGTVSVSPEVHNISDNESDISLNFKLMRAGQLHEYVQDKASEDYVIDSFVHMPESFVPIKTETKIEHGVKFEADVNSKPHVNSEPSVKWEADVKSEPSVKLESGVKFESGIQSKIPSNALQLVNDVKPTFTGKCNAFSFLIRRLFEILLVRQDWHGNF